MSSSAPRLLAEIETLKSRAEKAGWEHSHGSLHVVYVNDVIDWLDELSALVREQEAGDAKDNTPATRSSESNPQRATGGENRAAGSRQRTADLARSFATGFLTEAGGNLNDPAEEQTRQELIAMLLSFAAALVRETPESLGRCDCGSLAEHKWNDAPKCRSCFRDLMRGLVTPPPSIAERTGAQ